METFISSILENGLVKIELTVRPETAQHLYMLHLKGELSASNLTDEPPKRSQMKPVGNSSGATEVTPINSVEELDGNEVTLLAALADYPTSKPLPTSRELVHLVDWGYYSKTGSDDETARASSLRVNLQKLDGKGVFRKRGLKGNTERYLTEQGLEFAKQARVILYGPESNSSNTPHESDDEFPDFDSHGPVTQSVDHEQLLADLVADVLDKREDS